MKDDNVIFSPDYEVNETKLGTSSIIYKALDTKTNCQVALKIPNEATQNNPLKLENFVQVANKINAFSSNNILPIFKIYNPGGISPSYCIVTEWMDNTLADLIKDQSISVNGTLSILAKILSGVGEIHQENIIHRGLSLKNIFVSNNGNELKIGGFSLAASLDSEDTLQPPYSKYAAPESYNDKVSPNFQIDIYSIGMIVYEMLLGREEFQEVFNDIYSSNDSAIQKQRWLSWHLNDELIAPDLHEIDSSIPIWFSKIIAKMLEKTPSQRFTDIESLINEINQCNSAFIVEASQDSLSQNNNFVINTPESNQSKKEKKHLDSNGVIKPINLKSNGFSVKQLFDIKTKLGIAVNSFLLIIVILFSFIYFKVYPDLQTIARAKFEIEEIKKIKNIAIKNNAQAMFSFTQGVQYEDEANDSFERQEYEQIKEKVESAIYHFKKSLADIYRREMHAINKDLIKNEYINSIEYSKGEEERIKSNLNYESEKYVTSAKHAKSAISFYSDAMKNGQTQVLIRRIAQLREKLEKQKMIALEQNGKESQYFLKGENLELSAKEYEENNYYNEIVTSFEKVIEFYILAGQDGLLLIKKKAMEKLYAEIIELEKYNENNSFIEAVKYKKSAETHYIDADLISADQNYDKAINEFTQALADLSKVSERQIITSKKVKFKKGSSKSEIKTALKLCKTYFEECSITEIPDEKTKSVSIEPFEMDIYEVSNDQFKRFVEAENFETTVEKQGYAHDFIGFTIVKREGIFWKNAMDDQLPEHPVRYVSFKDANAYCQWVGGRLPSAEEWEYAARGDGRKTFPWGNAWQEENGVWKQSSNSSVQVSDSFSQGQTEKGLYHMAGNVWEWTTSRQNGQYIMKGGSYLENNPIHLRAASWRLGDSETAFSDDGFRCAYELK